MSGGPGTLGELASGIKPLAADPKAGKELATAAIVKCDPDELRRLAQQLHDEAVSVATDRQPVTNEQLAASSGIAAFMGEWEPHQQKYADAKEKWVAASTKYHNHIDEAVEELTTTANALTWIADNMEEAQKAAKENTDKVDTDLGADGGKGGKGSKGGKGAAAQAAPTPTPPPTASGEPTKYA